VCNIAAMRKLIVILLIAAVPVACSMPFSSKKAADSPKKLEKGKAERVDLGSEPKPGDIKIVDGLEYIYAKNRRYLTSPYEPEYIWYRKDQYSPGLLETLRGNLAGQDKKEREQLEKRLAKLEDDLKRKNTALGQSSPAYVVAQTGPLPGVPYVPTATTPTFSYPSPKMKRRVLVLPLIDQTNYKDEHLDELATKRMISRLENTQAIVCVDPASLNLKGDFLSPDVLRELNELYGIQAVVRGNLSDIFTTTSRTDTREEREISMALAKVSVDVYNTETGKVLRQLTARNPFSLTRERGDLASERAKVKAIDLAIELLADDLLKVILNLDWHTRIASIESDRVFLNAGRSSGLEKGDILEVYAPGDAVFDKTTGLPLGKTRGIYKGDMELQEIFGVDAAWGKAKNGVSFSPTDLVYLKK
jgi:hypothetical protein